MDVLLDSQILLNLYKLDYIFGINFINLSKLIFGSDLFLYLTFIQPLMVNNSFTINQDYPNINSFIDQKTHKQPIPCISTMQAQKSKTEQQYQFRSQIYTHLNSQYQTSKYTNQHSFPQIISICEQSLRSKIYSLKYQLPAPLIQKYKMDINYCEIDPFLEQEKQFLIELAHVCEKVITDPQYSHINKINTFQKQGKLGALKLNNFYKRFQLNFRYLNIKQAMVYTALSQCNVWYIIIKNRRKSKKQFDLDPLILYFQTFVARLKLKNPYHINILPRKQVKNIQRKSNKEKTTNELFEAVSNSDHNKVTQLLRNGAKIQLPSFLNNRQRNQVRCTHKACLNGDLKMCKILDSFGANWQAEDSQKMTPIFYAIQSSNMPVIKYLVQDLKVNIEKEQIQSRTPFYWACTQGDIHIIDYFYKAGCNINHKSQLGRTALSKSCYLGRRDIVLYLLKCKQIDVFSKCRKGRNALHNAVFGPKGGREGHKFGTNEKDSPECAQILLENGMDVDRVDEQQCTPLHVAMSSQAIQSIRLLIAHGASLTARNNYQQTPFMTGAKFGHVSACKILYEEYGDNILVKDCYDKNVLLLTAKFQQNSQDGTLNPAYIYFLQPFIVQCLKKGMTDELHRTFKELINNNFAQKLIVEITQLWKGFKKYQVVRPQLSIKQIQQILKISLACTSPKPGTKNQPHQPHQPQEINKEQVALMLQFTKQILRQIPLPAEKLSQIHIWLIKYNQPKILEFVHDNNLLALEKLQISPREFFYLFENDQLGLKEKVISFCILSLNFDWIHYRTQENSNILHLLVRKQRSGCIVQLFKALSGKIPIKMLTNKYLINTNHQQHKQILQKLLWSKDQSGLDAHQLSLVLKNKAVAKLIEQKLKEENLQFSNVLDVKQYQPVLETDPHQLDIFNNYQHQKQTELSQFQDRISKATGEEINKWCLFREQFQQTLQSLKQQQYNNPHQMHQAHQKFWKQTQTRKLHIIKNVQQLQCVEILYKQQVIGIDLQYFTHEAVTMISIFQLSSPKQDFIIDCLSIPLKQIKKYIQPILYNQDIVKIMHGCDNDLVLIKSLFNLSLINFVDTSRLDIQLRETGNDLRGLATLAKQYLGVIMSKEYQVSQWRIRPIPRAMLQYAKKDSMILPYLLSQMLNRIKDNPDRIKNYVLGGCKQARRNKKVSQPLIKQIKTL